MGKISSSCMSAYGRTWIYSFLNFFVVLFYLMLIDLTSAEDLHLSLIHVSISLFILFFLCWQGFQFPSNLTVSSMTMLCIIMYFFKKDAISFSYIL